VVLKENLHKDMWGKSVGTDGSLVQCVSDIRKTLHDKDCKIVRTFPKKGSLHGDFEVC